MSDHRAPHRDLLAEVARLERQSSRPPPPPMNPVRAKTALERGRDLAAAGRYGEALPCLTEAAGSPRYAAAALRLKAKLERRLGRPQKAIATLKDALHAAEGDARTSATLFEEVADIYGQLREMSEAAYYQRRAVELAPHRPELSERLAAYTGAGQLHRAGTRPRTRLP